MSKDPFLVEYARSSLSTCKGCLKLIQKNTLRIARVFKSILFDGDQLNWFHQPCFFKYHRPSNVDEIRGFHNIRYKDQQNIRRDVVKFNITVKVLTTKDGRQEAWMTKAGLRDFGVEYAKSGRAKCRLCIGTIEKMQVRVKKMVFDTDIGMKHGGEPLWHHLFCFAKVRTNLGWFATGRQLPGFNKLSKTDQSDVLKAITSVKLTDIKINPKILKISLKKRQPSETNRQSINRKRKVSHSSRMRNKRQMATILSANSQDVPIGSKELTKTLADRLQFGALAPCPTCGDGKLVQVNSQIYACQGHFMDGAKCSYTTQIPTRKPLKLPTRLIPALRRNRIQRNALHKLQRKNKLNI